MLLIETTFRFCKIIQLHARCHWSWSDEWALIIHKKQFCPDTLLTVVSVCLLHFFVSYASSASLFSPTLICVTCTNKYSGRRLKNHLIFTVFSPVYSNKVWERKNSHHKFSRIRFWECLLHLYILGLWPSASITLSETPILNFTLNLSPWHVHCFVIRGKVKWWQAKVLWNNSWWHCRWKGRNRSWQPKWLSSFLPRLDTFLAQEFWHRLKNALWWIGGVWNALLTPWAWPLLAPWFITLKISTWKEKSFRLTV